MYVCIHVYICYMYIYIYIYTYIFIYIYRERERYHCISTFSFRKQHGVIFGQRGLGPRRAMVWYR